LALWVPDLFFEKVKADEDWYLMDPNVSKNLADTFDDIGKKDFTNLYNKYVSENKFVKKVKARELWSAIITAQIETGQPYILAKDSCNKKSNQKNIGVVKSSNLCIGQDSLIEIKFNLNDDDSLKIKISELDSLFKSNKDIYVKSFDHNASKEIYSKLIKSGMTFKDAEVVKLTINDKELFLTEDHEVFTKNRGYVKAKDLLETDELVIS